MPEPIHVFWSLVAVLTLAAACNHGWHHARPDHLASRLARVSYRCTGARPSLAEPALEPDVSSGA